ncbi:hypothetical protein GGI23_002766 [Coemansia sp. RSA 2559]|nr:hypothetical protein GGI23_002766 [Coemansia sp. RSA 2559]KAJ2859250.1 hypothetical protein GGI22_003047 [Coemansia erecta]
MMGRIVRQLPKLQYLQLSETKTGPLTCQAIGSCLSGLWLLDVANCDQINDACPVVVAQGCKLLNGIKIEICMSITTHDVDELMAEYGCSPRVSDSSDDDHEDYEDYKDHKVYGDY